MYFYIFANIRFKMIARIIPYGMNFQFNTL
jgi:hypothetical protein